MNSQEQFDVCIIGGGMVGATMAIALSGQGLRIAVVEAFPFRSDQQPSYDARSIALAYGSHKIFDSIGLWREMRDESTAIKEIHISDQGQFGVTRIDAHKEDVDALGYVIENRVIGGALMQRLNSCEDVSLLCPAKLESIQYHSDGLELGIALNDGVHKIRTRLMVGADGGNSQVRKLLDIGVNRWEYGQTAIISTVTPAYKHNNVAYERFTPGGPMALLPMSENRCSLVLTTRDADVDGVMALEDDAFLSLLTDRFGYRLGAFTRVAKRHAYPLVMLKTKEHIRPGVAIIGNAAHTLHPVAGQGFNLGIRDVSTLAEVVVNAARQGEDIGSDAVLKRYEVARKRDHMGVIGFTDTVARVFSNQWGPLAHLRSKGLLVTDLVPPLKHFLTRRTMGMAGRLPRLSRGLPL
ncbi:MAG: 2-octaprenyl-6-methoxyphenyl hydroxylase [Gammaproteobacteria bacterium]|nr:2-octaprenyl-6-methoxyphenyl hydroxylase [Gammaproteobacteria bacterium]